MSAFQIRPLTIAVLGAVIVAIVFAASPLAGTVEARRSQRVYLALGDSASVGVGASDPASTGFVPLLLDDINHSDEHDDDDDDGDDDGRRLALENLAKGGERSDTFIDDGQLGAALTVLAERNGNRRSSDDVELVTLSIGGNDGASLFSVCGSGPQAPNSPECQLAAQTVLGGFASRFPAIVGQLRAAAGPDTPIVVMTYYNSLAHPGCPFHPFEAFGQVIVDNLNAVIAGTAAAVPGVQVADVATLGFGVPELQPDCLHPTDAGHRAIADEFRDTLGLGEEHDDDEEDDDDDD